MASSYHELGRVAQVRGSYDEALDWYRKSLRIKEELGNRAGMAISLSQMGVLFAERGAPEEAVPLNLRSLGLRLELRVPQVRIDLHWLGRQRADLGEDRFRELVAESVGEESLESVLGMLDEHAASQDDASASGAKGKPE
jgi:tetratricopeptide (TPR) repeat protein